MKIKQYMSVGEAIEAFLEKHKIKDKADMQAVILEWEQMMGKAIAQNTEKLWFNKGIFYVRVSSPVWRNELSFARAKIKEMINRKLGQELVQDVRIVG